jgi:hypothetical protein
MQPAAKNSAPPAYISQMMTLPYYINMGFLRCQSVLAS